MQIQRQGYIYFLYQPPHIQKKPQYSIKTEVCKIDQTKQVKGLRDLLRIKQAQKQNSKKSLKIKNYPKHRESFGQFLSFQGPNRLSTNKRGTIGFDPH